MTYKLELTPLENAIIRLQEAIQACHDNPEDTLYPDAAIQRFEFTYELSHKILKRYLEMTSASPGLIDEMSFPDLIRTGSEQNLLRNGWDTWQNYRKARGITSHTYDKAKAQQVLAIVPDFLNEATHLKDELAKRTSTL